MKVRFVSPADIEFDETVGYYDNQLPGLGFRFVQEVDAAIEMNNTYAGRVDQTRQANTTVPVERLPLRASVRCENG